MTHYIKLNVFIPHQLTFNHIYAGLILLYILHVDSRALGTSRAIVRDLLRAWQSAWGIYRQINLGQRIIRNMDLKKNHILFQGYNRVGSILKIN